MIMALKNTVQDYLQTIHNDSPGITCPACGSILGIRRQGSTEMILTENARLELDGNVASYRLYLEKLELVFAQRNIYYKAYAGNYPFARELKHYQRHSDTIEFNRGGKYKGIAAEAVIDQLIKELDFFEWIENFYSFPKRLDGLTLESQEAQAIFQKVRDVLLGGFEPRSIIGPLVDLLFDQKYVSDWREKIINSVEREKFQQFLRETCPATQWYLETLSDINHNLSKTHPEANQWKFDRTIEEGITRVQFILAVLLGHRSQSTDVYLNAINVKKDNPFSLPRKTVVYPKHLHDLLQSDVVLGNPQIGFSQNLLANLRKEIPTLLQDSNAFQPRTKEDERLTFENILNQLRNEVYKIVHFSCTGPVSKRLDSDSQKGMEESPQSPLDNARQQAEKESGNQSELENVFRSYLPIETMCGWYPKLEETHSVILLGSPGTSKSTTMLTGFTTFYDNIFALGATISFDSPEDEAMMKHLNEDFWAGKMPKPTKKGERTTIKLSVEFPQQGYPRTNFVFTDIAGEVMAKSLSEEGSDPAVLRILKNAETVIFFFDISIEPSIRKKLTEGDDGTWSLIETNFGRVRERRLNDDKTERSHSSADISQLQLLQRLIKDLREQKGINALRDGINFVCIIPKMDLFANETNNERFFFTNFLKDLKQRDILVQSNRGRHDESFSSLRSVGGTLAKVSNLEDVNLNSLQNDASISAQKEISRWISDRTLQYVRKIGDALSADTAKPIRASLQQTLEVGLIATLHHNFGQDRVYFLPVSAQGKDSDSLELGEAPNQKLSEYVFILPVILSVGSELPDPRGQRTVPQKTQDPDSVSSWQNRLWGR
jgi:hypothetical protein